MKARDYDDDDEEEAKGLWTPKSLREVSPPTVVSRLRCLGIVPCLFVCLFVCLYCDGLD